MMHALASPTAAKGRVQGDLPLHRGLRRLRRPRLIYFLVIVMILGIAMFVFNGHEEPYGIELKDPRHHQAAPHAGIIAPLPLDTTTARLFNLTYQAHEIDPYGTGIAGEHSPQWLACPETSEMAGTTIAQRLSPLRRRAAAFWLGEPGYDDLVDLVTGARLCLYLAVESYLVPSRPVSPPPPAPTAAATTPNKAGAAVATPAAPTPPPPPPPPPPPVPPVQPIQDYPPDAAVITVAGHDFTFSVPMPKDYTTLSFIDEDATDAASKMKEVRLYRIPIVFHDPDTYTISISLEHTNYQWNFEEQEHVLWDPYDVPIVLNPDLPDLVVVGPHVLVRGDRINAASYHALPLCTNGDHRGRWVPGHLLGYNKPRPLQSSENREDYPVPTYENHVWVPYTCRYRRWTHADFQEQCLEPHYPALHLYGDSNVRRGLKAIATGGAFCHTWYNETDSTCQCRDWNLSVPHMDPEAENQMIPDVAGTSNTYIYFFSWKGIQNWGPNWREAINATMIDTRLRAIDESREYAPPKAVVVSMINWDAAYGSWPVYEKAVPELVAYLKRTYTDHGIPIIFRPGQFYCCRIDEVAQGRRRLSHFRVAAMNELAQRMLVEQLGARIWDIYSLGSQQQGPARARGLSCGSNHAGRDFVDIENTILMNMLCNQVV